MKINGIKMKLLWVLLIASLLTVQNYSQVENATEDRSVLSLPIFYYDILNYASDDSGKTRVDVYIQVPYNQIQFVKSKDKFVSEYVITVSIYDEHKIRLLTEKSWTEKLETSNFDLTISRNSSHLSLRSFNLEPSKYSVKVEVEDKDSRKFYTYNTLFVVDSISTNFGISSILLIAAQNISSTSNKIIPNISGNVAQQKGMLAYYFEIYSAVDTSIVLNYSVINKQKETLYSNTIDYNLVSGRNQILYQIDELDVGLGEYQLNVFVKDQKFNLLAGKTKQFNSRNYGIPASIKDLDKAIEQMIYIANNTDIKFIQETNDFDIKLDRFLAFWKQRDPNPVTLENEIFNEYYRRIEYANKTFSNYLEGWKSDMGMVYIILGAPNNVDRHPFDYDSKPYEIWEYYNINRQFVFVDRTGFGDYRLATPFYGDNYRFR